MPRPRWQSCRLLLALGLAMTSATEVVIFAIACMALNILVGYTGLISFGHGAWFGLAAYAAATSSSATCLPGSILRSRSAWASPIVALASLAFGF